VRRRRPHREFIGRVDLAKAVCSGRWFGSRRKISLVATNFFESASARYDNVSIGAITAGSWRHQTRVDQKNEGKNHEKTIQILENTE
jgi:hypothetical protein